MIPDLRFVIGAVLATALLGVTAFGLGAAVHIAHQSKVGPLEASRMLAYTPNDSSETARQAGGPFAKIPTIPATPPALQAPSAIPAQEPVRTADAAVADATTAAVPPLDDTDAVDERAVIDPPLPPDTDPPSSETTAADTAPEPAPAPSVTTAPVLDPAPAVTTAPVLEPAPAVTTATVPAPAAEIPVELSAPSMPPDIEPVGSIPAVEPAAAEAIGAPPAIAAPSKRKAAPKAKQPARKAVAKAKPKLRANPGTIQPTASTGYPVTSDYAVTAPAARARGGNSSKGLWSDF